MGQWSFLCRAYGALVGSECGSLHVEWTRVGGVKSAGGTPAVRKERERDWGKQVDRGVFWVGAQAEAYATEKNEGAI